jgi:putative glutamine amidotransferase
MSPLPPLIGITACLRQEEGFPFHAVGDKYVGGALAAGGVPVLVPAIGAALELDALLARLDGLLVTGSPSNIEPHHYAGPPPPEGSPRDPARDATTLPLIRRALATGVPLFAICRGQQELNVALGGTLHQELHRALGRRDHRSDKTRPPFERYDPRHTVHLTPGGTLERLLGTPEISVNSLHGQGIDRLAPGLVIEALAEDGTIEAVRVEGAAAFALAVQWHPEWRPQDNPVSRRLFAAFGAACRRRAAARSAHEPARELA